MYACRGGGGARSRHSFFRRFRYLFPSLISICIVIS